MIGWVGVVVKIALILATIPHPHVAGVASWYDWKPREAAAGPSLRAALGPGWRGKVVTVCRTEQTWAVCVKVRLTDWCACRGRVIDLDRRTFALLASPSRGLVRVSVRLP